MKEKFKLEDEKTKAVSKALDKYIYDENDIHSVLKQIENAENDMKRDKFTKKYAFVA